MRRLNLRILLFCLICSYLVLTLFMPSWGIWNFGGQEQPGQEPAAPAGGNYVMVNSIVASGQVATPMASTNYQMRAVLGEPGLPDNETNLTSANYQHQPGFLAAEPSTATPSPTPTGPTPTPDPNVTPSVTPTPGPTGNSADYLPAIVGQPFRIFDEECEDEPNDIPMEANGALISGQSYCGYPDDTKDYFKIYPFTGGTVLADLTNHTGVGVQLQLFYQTTDNRVDFDTGQGDLHVEYNGPAGLYYIYIFTDSGLNDDFPYTLVVTYP